MKGAMQNWPLTTSSVLRHASTVHGHREIVTNTVVGPTNGPATCARGLKRKCARALAGRRAASIYLP
eukprot:scaffold1500_cov398-Prasinococcus_capsulatus_cf.AAC.13